MNLSNVLPAAVAALKSVVAAHVARQRLLLLPGQPCTEAAIQAATAVWWRRPLSHLSSHCPGLLCGTQKQASPHKVAERAAQAVRLVQALAAAYATKPGVVGEAVVVEPVVAAALVAATEATETLTLAAKRTKMSKAQFVCRFALITR